MKTKIENYYNNQKNTNHLYFEIENLESVLLLPIKKVEKLDHINAKMMRAINNHNREADFDLFSKKIIRIEKRIVKIEKEFNDFCDKIFDEYNLKMGV